MAFASQAKRDCTPTVAQAGSVTAVQRWTGMQNTMPDHRSAYSATERRIAVWLLVAVLALAAVAGVMRELMPPSLGAWDRGASLPAPPGVIDAKPLPTVARAQALA